METAEALLSCARDHHVTIAACESLTAGLFMATLAAVPGASDVLRGGFVTYTNEMKERLAHVDPAILEQYGAVSEPCARAMAANTRVLTGADYAVSFTGNAGPSGSEGKPAGLVYCAVASGTGCRIYRYDFDHASRNDIRTGVVRDMTERLLQVMKEELNGEKTGNCQER
ncbi:CinA family protein [Faecalibaculum rodentium]|uniref:CinA family protein n=1 Tax=Faecalibaculum rodentium TaxID=1702221 RepID=UPI0025A53ECA|nr:CinA family protein [Faecalibaculum rodentium]